MFGRLRQSFRQFMYGRYGRDRLNLALVIVGGTLVLLSRTFVRLFYTAPGRLLYPVYYTLWIGGMALLGWCVFRFCSRNIAARQKENRTFCLLWQRVRDRKHRYYDCPHCHQMVRVPKGRGKVCIKCPRCAEKFIRKS